MLGTACDGGSYIDQSVKRPGDPTNIKLYFDGTCVTGVMPKYGEHAAQLINPSQKEPWQG